MRWIVIVLALSVAGACGGPKIPAHSGYKNAKSKPWSKPKNLSLNAKNEARAEGDLSYAEYRRAKWYAVSLPSHGELTIKLESNGPGDGIDDDFDLALEILDPHNRVIAKSDKEEEDAGETNKKRTLTDLQPGRYLIHVYLQDRRDIADYLVRIAFKPTPSADQPTDFPAQVAFVPPLAMVPLEDDTPARLRKPVRTTRTRTPRPPKPTPQPPKPATVLTARIVNLSVNGSGTRIVVGRGTTTGAQSGMKATLKGIPGSFPVDCNETTCSATVNATPDQVRSAGGMVTLVP